MPGPGNPDPKLTALVAARAVHRRAGEVSDPVFAASDFFDARDVVQVKYEMVRRAKVGEASVSAAAAAFGFSRQSFYQAAAALEAGGLPGLLPGKPGPRGPRKLTGEVVDHLLGLRAADPARSSAALAEAAAERFGVRVHPRSVERALARRAREDSKSG
jgi:transposase